MPLCGHTTIHLRNKPFRYFPETPCLDGAGGREYIFQLARHSSPLVFVDLIVQHFTRHYMIYYSIVANGSFELYFFSVQAVHHLA